MSNQYQKIIWLEDLDNDNVRELFVFSFLESTAKVLFMNREGEVKSIKNSDFNFDAYDSYDGEFSLSNIQDKKGDPVPHLLLSIDGILFTSLILR